MSAELLADDGSAPTFEDAVKRLEAIVASLENDNMSLEQSLSAYEEGVALARVCLKRLDTAELRIQEIKAEHD